MFEFSGISINKIIFEFGDFFLLSEETEKNGLGNLCNEIITENISDFGERNGYQKYCRFIPTQVQLMKKEHKHGTLQSSLQKQNTRSFLNSEMQ